MAASVVQSRIVGAVAATTSQAFTFAVTPTAGSRLAFWLGMRGLQTITLPSGVSWVTGSPFDVSDVRGGFAVSDAVSDGVTNSWTFSLGGSAKPVIGGFEMAGVDAPTVHAEGSWNLSPASTAGVAHTSGDLVIFGLSLKGSNTATIPAPYTGSAGFDSTSDGGNRTVSYLATWVSDSTATAAPSVTLGGDSNWLMGMLTVPASTPEPPAATGGLLLLGVG